MHTAPVVSYFSLILYIGKSRPIFRAIYYLCFPLAEKNAIILIFIIKNFANNHVFVCIILSYDQLVWKSLIKYQFRPFSWGVADSVSL